MPARHDTNRRLLRARDEIDRSYADALDIEALARSVHLSRAHFIRSFRNTFGETRHRSMRRSWDRGVEFTEAPVERFYGTDCALRDPFGNSLRITQPAEIPAAPPS